MKTNVCIGMLLLQFPLAALHAAGVTNLRSESPADAVGHRLQSAMIWSPSGGQTDFGAYYTQLNTGKPWEAVSRTGKFADIVVQVSKAGGQLVFWRGNSYLPYWETAKGQWDLAEIVARSGDGAKPMPDRVSRIYQNREVK